jgi:uncharacterized membrane protein YfcA
MAGLPPIQALATNKIQALSSVTSSAVHFARAGYVDFRTIRPKAAAAFAGATAGAVALRIADPDLLRRVSPVILIGIALFFLTSGNPAKPRFRWPIDERWIPLTIVIPISFYDGFFGPGTGAMYVAALIFFSTRSLPQATAEAKVLNALGSTAAALIFLPGSVVIWPAAIAMALGGALGGQLGARLAVKWGAPFIRAGIVIVSIALALRLIAQQLG